MLISKWFCFNTISSLSLQGTITNYNYFWSQVSLWSWKLQVSIIGHKIWDFHILHFVLRGLRVPFLRMSFSNSPVEGELAWRINISTEEYLLIKSRLFSVQTKPKRLPFFSSHRNHSISQSIFYPSIEINRSESRLYW